MAIPKNIEMLEAREVPVENNKKKKMNDKEKLFKHHEIKIARSLAENDQVIRNRAVKSLKRWLHHRAQHSPFTEEDFTDLWRGLFFSMWQSDKPLIQEDCAENIANLLHELSIESGLNFFKYGLITLMNEWFGIDQFRLDKFMMLVRRLLRQAFFMLKKNNFQKSFIESFGDILSLTILDLSKKNALGMFMHFTEIYLEELAKVTDGTLKPELVTLFLMPFMKCMALADDVRCVNQIKKHVFVYLINQSDVGLEYQEKYNAWKREGFPGTIHSMQKIKKGTEEELTEEETEDGISPKDNSKPLDPRAGRVDVELPQIKFNSKNIADQLLTYKYQEGTSATTRNTITSLSKQFRKLSNGVYPLGVTTLGISRNNSKETNIKKAVNRLVKFEKKLLGQDARTIKRKLKNETSNNENSKKQKMSDEIVEDEELKKFIENSESEIDIKKQKKKNRKKEKQQKTKKETVLDSEEEIENKNKKLKRKPTETNIFKTDTPLRKKMKRRDSLDLSDAETAFKRNSGFWLVYQQDPNDSSSSLNTSSSDLGNFLEEKIMSMNDEDSGKKDDNNTKFQNSSSVVSPRKDKKDSISNGVGLSPKKGEGKSRNVKNGVVPAVTVLDDSWWQEGEASTGTLFPDVSWEESDLPEKKESTKDYTEKLEKISRRSAFNVQQLINNSLKDKKRLSVDFSGSDNCSSTPKKVIINTKLNQSQEFEEYHSQIMCSPCITFDANKKPGKPVLKRTSLCSPVNPFYGKH